MMQEKVAKLLEEAKAAHHAKLHEHQEAEAGLAQFQQHVSNLALQVIQLDARVKAFQEVVDVIQSSEPPPSHAAEGEGGTPGGRGEKAASTDGA